MVSPLWKLAMKAGIALAIVLAIAAGFFAGRDYEYRHPWPRTGARVLDVDVEELRCIAEMGGCEVTKAATGELILRPGLYRDQRESRLVFETVREARCEINQSDNWRLFTSGAAVDAMPEMSRQADAALCAAVRVEDVIQHCVRLCGRPNPGGR